MGNQSKGVKMFLIIVGALVGILVFFFERWWTAHHPVAPTADTKTAFLAEVARPRHFWMGSKRHAMASKLYDKYVAKYNADPPIMELSTKPLTQEEAHAIATRYSLGLTLDPTEI